MIHCPSFSIVFSNRDLTANSSPRKEEAKRQRMELKRERQAEKCEARKKPPRRFRAARMGVTISP